MAKKFKLYELKEGDKFYNTYDDNLIHVFKSCEYDPTNHDVIKFRTKRYKIDRFYFDMSLHGTNSAEREFYKYIRRDINSFMAGFNSAIALCEPHMGVFDKENAGIEDILKIHILAQKRLKNWEKNLINK